MSFTNITKELLNQTLTENGDKAYSSTGTACLDYFALIGGKRYDLMGCSSLFFKALFEDKVTATKLLFYTRDIRGGLGERNIFRLLLSIYASQCKDQTKKLLKYIPEYGRYDDLLCLLSSEVEDDVIELIQSQLESDIENKKNGRPISLLAKWMPSINTSNKEARQKALYLAKKLNMSNKEYRQTLSFLRKNMIVETNLCEKDYSFDYAKVPSSAMLKYVKAFNRNDEERFKEYLTNVNTGKVKMNTEVLDVVNFVKRLTYNDADLKYAETTWKELTKDSIDSRTLVVRDGSGSMYAVENAIHVANAMSLLCSSRLTGEFKDKFITFSSRPKFVDLSCYPNIVEKVKALSGYNDCTNTNIEAVYNLILNVYKSKDFKKEDQIERVMIISDMEFDAALGNYSEADSNVLMSTFENFKSEFEKLGYKMPEIVFWNAASRGQKVPVGKNELGVKLVSGSSKNVVDLVINNKSINPKDFMDKILLNYAFVDEVFKEV